MYVAVFFSCTLAVVRTCTCYVRASTSTSIYVRTRSRPEWQRYVRFDQVGPDCQALPCLQRCSWWVPAVRGKCFFAKYGGPSDGSLLSGGGIIILRVIRRHFLATAMEPAVSLSTYSTLPMEVVPWPRWPRRAERTRAIYNNLYIAHGNFLCNLLQSFFWLVRANFAYFRGFQTISNTETRARFKVLWRYI